MQQHGARTGVAGRRDARMRKGFRQLGLEPGLPGGFICFASGATLIRQRFTFACEMTVQKAGGGFMVRSPADTPQVTTTAWGAQRAGHPRPSSPLAKDERGHLCGKLRKTLWMRRTCRASAGSNWWPIRNLTQSAAQQPTCSGRLKSWLPAAEAQFLAPRQMSW